MNKQANGKKKNIVWPQISACVQEDVDTDSTEIEAGPVKKRIKVSDMPHIARNAQTPARGPSRLWRLSPLVRICFLLHHLLGKI